MKLEVKWLDSHEQIVLSLKEKHLKVLKMRGFGKQNNSKKKSNKKIKVSKEQIINQAFMFHSQENI